MTAPIIAVAIASMMIGLSVRANSRFRAEERLPMQWSISGSVNWTAPRVMALDRERLELPGPSERNGSSMSATWRHRLRDVVFTTAQFALLTSCATSAAMPGEAGECRAANAARTLEMVRFDPATMDRRVRWSAAADAGMIENRGGAVFEGRCAGAIRTFSVNSVFLIDGGRLEVTPTGLEPSDWPNSPAEPIGPSDPHPRARGVFVMGDRVGYRGNPGGPLAYYIGLWRDGSGSVLRAWSEQAGGGFTAPRDILRLGVDGLSLTYFPAVDTPSGGLHVTYRIDDRRTGLVLFNWSHPNLF